MNFIETLYKLDNALTNSEWDTAIDLYHNISTEMEKMRPAYDEAMKIEDPSKRDYYTYPFRQVNRIYDIAYDLIESYRWGNPNVNKDDWRN